MYLVITVMLIGCSASNFSKKEKELLLKNNIHLEDLSSLKRYANTEFFQFETTDPGFVYRSDSLQKTGIEEKEGVSFRVKLVKAKRVRDYYRKKLKDKGYTLFYSDVPEYSKNITFSIIPCKDQFEIIRLQKTDGINYDITNEDLITKLKEWDKRYSITILGADYDWVTLKVDCSENELDRFAKEVVAFCPDFGYYYENGEGKVKETLFLNREVFLWWD
jgi:hypothetical protein